MKEIKFALLVALICMSNLAKSQSKNLLLDIRFQDQFNMDTIEFRINRSLIFSNVILTSDRSTGITSTVVKIYKLDNKTLRVEYLQNIITIKATNILDLCLIMNKRKTYLKVNPNKGTFVGLSKKPNNLFEIIQQKSPFMYD